MIDETLPIAGDLQESDPTPDRLSPLIRQFTNDGRTLVRQEVDLAKLEVKTSLIGLAKGSALVTTGAAFLSLGMLVLLVFVILGAGSLLGGRYWLSTLIVGGILGLLGLGILILGRRGLNRDSLKPSLSISSARETGEWAADAARDFKDEIKRGKNG